MRQSPTSSLSVVAAELPLKPRTLSAVLSSPFAIASWKKSSIADVNRSIRDNPIVVSLCHGGGGEGNFGDTREKPYAGMELVPEIVCRAFSGATAER